jgi:4-hydroxyphenylacetate 3-monooxygenase
LLRITVRAADGSAREVALERPNLVIAGFTGRDARLVEQHIAELGEIGVPRPSEVPALFVLPNWLLATGGTEPLQVGSETTSGEAEPVLIRMPDGELLVAVGSDHTDREVERISLALSKGVSPKIVSSEAWRFSEVADRWDDIRVMSFSGDEPEPYQDGTLALIRRPEDLLERCDRLGLDRGAPLVVFLGTVPLARPGFDYAARFEARLVAPNGAGALSCTYHVAPARAGQG